MALGQHLGANEYVGNTLFRHRKRSIHGPFALRCVAVNTLNTMVRESLLQRLLQPLGSFAERFDLGTAARTR